MPIQRKLFYRRNLPHWQPAETDFFITYRLAGSLPVSKIIELKEKYSTLKKLPENLSKEKQEALNEDYFLSFDESLNKNLNEPYWLKEKQIGQTVLDSLLFNHTKTYFLWCVCMMPNHAHVLLSTLKNAPTLDVILQNHKKFTALHCNRLLNRDGQFWHRESYDRIIRNDRHFNSTVHYILMNPVKAGFVKQWQDWELLYIDESLRKEFEV